MIELAKTLLGDQLAAALATLATPIARCPGAAWNARVANLTFDQVAFHALFFTDYHLGAGPEGFREQAFHRAHPAYFRDYEELEDRPQTNAYDRATTLAYAAHCREKAARAIASETAASLAAPAGFPRRAFSRAELYVYVTRHLQHHAAQLGLLLRRDHGIDLPWIGSGWADP